METGFGKFILRAGLGRRGRGDGGRRDVAGADGPEGAVSVGGLGGREIGTVVGLGHEMYLNDVTWSVGRPGIVRAAKAHYKPKR